ncbi:MAG: methylated-DNA--[protein]-cysteine S-methyltransferase [Candidatus Dormibacteraeota bacterium]|nr:methylated-DNA--[protein]-cysteine S-methyltransferase [Candidatus Dormibacteraeota bacterium]MBV9525207.1 methylated-DNA--[protein]-cysteine S-methyltransferase [Candidatus Dormibacteraeota bacterium]
MTASNVGTAGVTAARLHTAVDGFRLRARAEGLVDVAYALADSPIGPLLLAGTDAGLVTVAFDGENTGVLDELAARLSPRILRDPARLDPVRRELDAYFEGKLRDFTVPVDWALVGPFGRRVLDLTARIPYGEVSSYSDVARSIGAPRAARAVGNALGANPIPVVVPCHRVVRIGGDLGGYGGGLRRKEFLLSLEGARPRL